MSTHTLPEVPADIQLAELRMKLAGHQVFGRTRGKFGGFPFSDFLKQETPTESDAAFETWAADRRTMLHMLSVLKRDGKMAALKELRTALLDSSFVMTGEEIPVQETEPGVLVIPNPEKTLLIVRWLYSSRYQDALEYVTGKYQGRDRGGNSGLLTPKLFEVFPELRDQFKTWTSHPSSLTHVVHGDIVDLWKKFEEESLGLAGLWIDRNRTDMWYFANAIGAFVHNATQQQVLPALGNRIVQASYGTWRFDYPKIIEKLLHDSGWSRSPVTFIGFHPEEEHARWTERWPSFVSKGCSHGHGAIILTKEMAEEKTGDKLVYNALLDPSIEYTDGDLEKSRILLGFPYQSSSL